MTKKELLDEIKEKAVSCISDPILLYHKGVNVGCLKVPPKLDFETWKEFMERYEVDCRGKGEYLLTIDFDYVGSISILVDEIRGI